MSVSAEKSPITEADFRSKRRQKFLTAKYFQLNDAYCAREIELNSRAIADEVFGPDNSSFSGIRGSSARNALKRLRLHFTSGDSIDSLKPLYDNAVYWFEEWHKAEHVYSLELARRTGKDLRDDMSPLEFEDLTHFQLALDLVSVGILLGAGQSVRRLASWMHSTRGSDMLVEYLLETVVPDPLDVEEFFHEQPYGTLLDAIYTADTPMGSVGYIQKYLTSWYKAFEGTPWHNGHLVQTDEYSNYEGYWAFEAAAVCVLKGIDDSSFRDHLVYPKDLADWARAHKVTEAIRWRGASEIEQALRCEAGQSCPREGWWSTPAGSSRRQRFSQGDVMPDLGGAYGATIWQWDEQQDE